LASTAPMSLASAAFGIDGSSTGRT
jgi:hypothetical protein